MSGAIRVCAIAALPAALLAAPLAAPDAATLCELDMKAAQCKAAVEEALRQDGIDIADSAAVIEKAKDKTLSNAEDTLRLFNTGLASALGEGGVSTFEDFLPKFRLFAAGGGSDDDGERIVLEINDLFGLPTDDGYKVTAALTRPAVFEPLLQTVDESDRAAQKDTLEQRIDDFDDVTFSFTYSPMTERWGRSDHQLHAAVFEELFASAETTLETGADAAREGVNDALDAALGSADADALETWAGSNSGFCASELARQELLEIVENFNFDELSGDQLLCMALVSNRPTASRLDGVGTVEATRQLDDATTRVVENYLAAIDDSVREEYRNLGALQASLEEFGFFGFPQLINNQPQLNFTASATSRDNLVGQDEFNLKVSYEKGFVNVNDFRDFSRNGCGSDVLYRCLRDYLTPARKRHLERGDRLSFNLEYSRRQAYDAVLEATGGMLSLPAETSLTASLGYGRYLTFVEGGAGNSRVEFSASYEDVDSDSLREDRLLGTLTYSQRLSDKAALSFSLVYANKPEFLGDVGEEISANLGINYKMFSPKEF